MKSNDIPLISVITPSLNTGAYLVDTIRSIKKQTYLNIEHIIIDGGSTDTTLEVLESYPEIKLIHEPGNILEAYRVGFNSAKGKYIIQCCISDGFIDDQWFARTIEILENDYTCSLVWGLPQYMDEQGLLKNISFDHFLKHSPTKNFDDFLIFFLATGFFFPEGNYCVDANILKNLFPSDDSPNWQKTMPHLGFVLNFIERGLISRFIPGVANYGRIHSNQRGERLRNIENKAYKEYRKEIRRLYNRLKSKKVIYNFNDRNLEKIYSFDVRNISRRYYFQKVRESRLANKTFNEICSYLYKILKDKLKIGRN